MAEPINVDQDDDIVFMDAETAEQSLVAKLPSLEMIANIVKETNERAQMAQTEVHLMKQELNNPEAQLSKEITASVMELLGNPDCEVSFDMTEHQLGEMITQILESMPPDMFDIGSEEFKAYNKRLDKMEWENQSISKMFLECHTRLKEIRQLRLKETAALEKEISEFTPKPVTVDDADLGANRLKFLQPTEKLQKSPSVQISNQSSPADGRSIQGGVTSFPPHPANPAKQQWSNTNAAQVLVQPHQQQMPSMEMLRSHLASTITQSMPALVSSLQQQFPMTQIPVPSQHKARPMLHNWPVLKVQDKVLGKKFNDVWYSGTVMDITESDPLQGLEWRCRVKFDGKGMKWLPGRQVAYREPINIVIRVGTRIVALYREDDAPSTFYAGVIAEAPSQKNSHRFLVFFDDGYAQYCDAKELHKVYTQSQNVWEDINPETSAFIKEYMRIYPERPMVRLTKGQVVRTEWNGKWWTSKVVETDASLVKMYFQADKRTEWIYRGSTRLEPLFKALANADAIKAVGSARGRRHNLTARPLSGQPQKPSVEYTRGTVDDDVTATSSTSSQSTAPKSQTAKSAPPTPQSSAPAPQKKKLNVAKKSTTPSAMARIDSDKGKQQRQAEAEAADKRGKQNKDMASVLQERLSVSNKVEYDGELATGERRETKIETKARVPFKMHSCCKRCLQGIIDNPVRYKGYNSFQIPLLYGWERQVCKTRPAGRRQVAYRTPCGRRLRNIKETDYYLFLTDSLLTIDMFSFDQHLHVNTEFVPIKTFCDIKDLSYGRENYPISCVNGVDRHYPDYVEYSDHRIPSKGVNLNTDPDFLVCCDCTDNCRDRSKCACQQLTIQNTTWIGDKDTSAGYHFRRLKEPLFTGIVECNSRCKCDKRCSNRVAQHGLSMRLQVFKTEKKGWGLRCLDDIAKGSFICIYAGQLLTDREANEDGKQYGDQYLAELDFIEVVERQKEGYESDVDIDFSDDDKDANYKASKDSEEDSDYNCSVSPTHVGRRTLRRRNTKDSNDSSTKRDKDNDKEKDKESIEEGSISSKTTSQERSVTPSDEEDEDNGTGNKQDGKKRPRARKSTGGSKLNPSASMKPSQETIDEKEKEKRQPTRSFFRDDTECYIMDAKSMGNLGRYLNHSCNPNVFVQNIFVDTHDLRFPWVTFWAGQYIRAGTELTWDYNYEVGSVPDRVLYCYCNSPMCRGRLL